MLELVGFDADDTLWHDARHFLNTEEQLHRLVRDHVDLAPFAEALQRTNEDNLARYGYGIKSYLLSAVEVLSRHDRPVPPRLLGDLIDLGKAALDRGTELLDGAGDLLTRLQGKVQLVLITKGDLTHQQLKLGRSGLLDLFDRVEVVSEKTDAVYLRIFGPPQGEAPHAAMIGNSVRSDILPAIQVGAWGLHVPHEITWAHEVADAPLDSPLYRRFDTIDDAGEWVLAHLR